MKKVLFVCLGNICRSPAAEGVMQYLLKRRKLENKIFCDSAGTCAYHVGEKADSRMRNSAGERGIALTSISRQFRAKDFEVFDYVVVMDQSNYNDVAALDPGKQYSDKIYHMIDFCRNHKVDKVPDPYYGGAKGFETVLDIVEDGCTGLIDKIEKEL